MAEPSTTTVAAAAATTATAVALLPGVDGNAAVGAACGALLFVTSARDLALPLRGLYLLISFAIGYLGGPALLGEWIEPSAVSAFVTSATVVTAGLRAIEGVRTMDVTAWLGRRGK